MAGVGKCIPASVKAALDHVDDAVIVASPDDALVIHVNRAFARMSMYSRDEVVGRPLASLLHPHPVADQPNLFVMTRADGEECVVRRKRELVDGVADVQLLFETYRDVTTEHAVRESEALYRRLAERSSDLISRADATARCIYISSSCRDILGYEPEELVGRHALIDLAHPDDVAEQRRVLARFTSEGRTSGSPLRRRLRRKDGTYVWLEVATHIERDEDGQIVEVQSWARDITARVLAEQALAKSESNVRSVLDGLPDGVAVNRGGVIVYANDELVRMLGYDLPADLIGRSLLDFVHADEREAVADVLRDNARTGVRARERRILSRDGTVRNLEVTSLPVIFEGQLGFLAICQDVTEHKRMAERLALAERMALVGRLASGVGHEINNPIAYMLGSIELARADLAALAADTPKSPKARLLEHHLVTLKDGAERVRDIVRDLRALSAVGDDQLGPVDVEHALDVAAATAQHEIRLRARLVKEYASVSLVLANEGRLAQVFVNLLVNAAQAIPEGDASENEIRVSTREEGGLVIVEVRDTGVGIAPEHLPQIFEPFFTTKPKNINTGLGLSISHNIVTAQGGMLSAERLAPRGALFRVTLRTFTGAPAQATSPAAVEDEVLRARVLIVDDEPRLVEVLAQLLARHDVTLAYSGREAMALLATDVSFDAIVCDLQMNDGTGADVYDYLSAHAPELACRLIFTTGGAFTQGAREFLARCRQPVLEKPFNGTQLTTLVTEMARRSEKCGPSRVRL
jgi:PAS domain S-box-containing protein